MTGSAKTSGSQALQVRGSAQSCVPSLVFNAASPLGAPCPTALPYSGRRGRESRAGRGTRPCARARACLRGRSLNSRSCKHVVEHRRSGQLCGRRKGGVRKGRQEGREREEWRARTYDVQSSFDFSSVLSLAGLPPGPTPNEAATPARPPPLPPPTLRRFGAGAAGVLDTGTAAAMATEERPGGLDEGSSGPNRASSEADVRSFFGGGGGGGVGADVRAAAGFRAK